MKCVRMVFSAPVLTSFFSVMDGKAFQCLSGLPEGAKLIDLHYNRRTQTGVMSFEHDSFDTVESIEKAPFIEAAYTAYAIGDPNRDRTEADDNQQQGAVN